MADMDLKGAKTIMQNLFAEKKVTDEDYTALKTFCAGDTNASQLKIVAKLLAETLHKNLNMAKHKLFKGVMEKTEKKYRELIDANSLEALGLMYAASIYYYRLDDKTQTGFKSMIDNVEKKSLPAGVQNPQAAVEDQYAYPNKENWETKNSNFNYEGKALTKRELYEFNKKSALADLNDPQKEFKYIEATSNIYRPHSAEVYIDKKIKLKSGLFHRTYMDISEPARNEKDKYTEYRVSRYDAEFNSGPDSVGNLFKKFINTAFFFIRNQTKSSEQRFFNDIEYKSLVKTFKVFRKYDDGRVEVETTALASEEKESA